MPKPETGFKLWFTKPKINWKTKSLSGIQEKTKERIWLNWLRKNKPGTTKPRARIQKITRKNTMSFISPSIESRRESSSITKDSISETEPFRFLNSIEI